MTRPYPRIFFDGGCRPNPGMMETAVVFRGRLTVDRAAGPGTSIDAEWLALIRAAELAASLGLDGAVLLGDAATVVNQASGTQRCKTADLRAHLARFRAIVAPLPALRVRHVPRSQNLAGIALAGLSDR